MIRSIESSSNGAGLRVGVAVATWNQVITDRLLEGALARLETLGVASITVLRVPGALELPVAAMGLIEDGADAVVAIGTVIKGDTDHYEIVVRESTAGIAAVALEAGIPVTNAVLAVHTYDQAVERAGHGDANKGVEVGSPGTELEFAL